MSDDVNVDVRRDGRRFDAEAVLELAADAATVWATITDYDALPGFMPGIRSCQVIERHAPTRTSEQLVVIQRGEFRFLLFSQAMTVRLHIEHQFLRMAQAKAVSFDLGLFRPRAIDVFEGRYELEPLAPRAGAPRTRLRYTAVIGLRLPPPPAVGSVAVRQNLSAQLIAVAAEISRRSAAAAASQS
jgi:hypothetical protein